METIDQQIATLQQLVADTNARLTELRKQHTPPDEVKGVCGYVFKRKLGNPVCGNACHGPLCRLHTPEYMAKVSQAANKWNKSQRTSDEARAASRAYHREYMLRYKVHGPQYNPKPIAPPRIEDPAEK